MKIAMIGARAGWLVGTVVGTPKLLRSTIHDIFHFFTSDKNVGTACVPVTNIGYAQQILFLSITVQTDTARCKHFESVPPLLQLLWFVGNMSLPLSLSSQIGVPSKALGAVGSCG